MEATVRAHLESHHGVLSARDLARLGLTPNQVRALVKAGELTRVCRGAYLDPARLAGATPQDAHTARVRAVVLSRGGALAASHQSAAALHGLPLLREELEPVRVVHTTDLKNTRRHDAFTVHPAPGRDCLTEVDGVPLVTAALAVVGTAMLAGQRSGLMAADAALRRGLTTREELHEQLHRLTRHPGIARARSVVVAADPSAESPGETLLRVLLLELGVDVVPQYRIVDGSVVVARVDFYLPSLRVVVEFDGLVKYDGRDGKEALAAEKRREERIRGLGYGVARVVWADLFIPGRVAALVRAAAQTR